MLDFLGINHDFVYGDFVKIYLNFLQGGMKGEYFHLNDAKCMSKNHDLALEAIKGLYCNDSNFDPCKLTNYVG